ncbi:hypothetical protein LINPERHAP2_LOCUS12593 [Linum perenne]
MSTLKLEEDCRPWMLAKKRNRRNSTRTGAKPSPRSSTTKLEKETGGLGSRFYALASKEVNDDQVLGSEAADDDQGKIKDSQMDNEKVLVVYCELVTLQSQHLYGEVSILKRNEKERIPNTDHVEPNQYANNLTRTGPVTKAKFIKGASGSHYQIFVRR